MLVRASCRKCAKITSKFEQDVAREMWGDARNSYNGPSRHKKRRKARIVLTDPRSPGRSVEIPYAEYPAPMVFYKMNRAGLLQGLPDTFDISGQWQLVAIADMEKAKQFESKFGVPLTAKFRHVPQSFARLLIKIAYCNLLCALDPGDFRPICLPSILGSHSNPSYIVGGTFELAPPEGVGYRLATFAFGTIDRMMFGCEIRLYANAQTPTYHVLVGDVAGAANVSRVMAKLGDITVLPFDKAVTESSAVSDHWAPSLWPLPFWGSN